LAQFTPIAPAITTSGTTWAQLKTGGLELLLTNLIAANTAILNPTVAATTAAGSGASSLPYGAYFASYTWVDAFGETLVGASESTPAVTTASGATATLTVTIPALPTFAKCANIYLTTAGGASGSETLYATGITTTTFACTYAVPADQPTESLPTVNHTGAAAHIQRILALCTRPSSELILERAVELMSSVLSGAPMQSRDIYHEADSWYGIHALWTQAFKEFNTLVLANLPSATLATTTTPLGFPVRGWVLP
jgi:hypothetical protein